MRRETLKKACGLALLLMSAGNMSCTAGSTEGTVAVLERGVLTGGVSAHGHTALEKYYTAGKLALDHRIYADATRRFRQAIHETDRGHHNDKLECLSKIGLAEAYMGLDRYEQAESLLNITAKLCLTEFGESSQEYARMQHDLARCYLHGKKIDKAHDTCVKALALREQLAGKGHHDTAVTLALLAEIQELQGFKPEAVATFNKALQILEHSPGVDRVDYADALYGLGLTKLANGDEAGASQTLKQAMDIKDAAVHLDKNPLTAGAVKYVWKEGVPGSKQVYDQTYPLKYMMVNGVRVAATVVKSQKHVVALVSLANCTNHPVSVAVGPVHLDKISQGFDRMFWCDPNLIDLTLEEEYVQNYTWTRRWISHILKTRRLPGYLKNGHLDPDNFYGSNVFGTYGVWDGAPRTTPPLVTREQYYFDEKVPYEDIEKSLARSDSQRGYSPALIDPGDARTGVQVYLYKKADTVRVTVNLGNATAEFPFTMPLGQERR